MRKIESIIRVEKHLDPKDKSVYYRTFAMVGGDEVVGWSRKQKAYKVGDEVETFFDTQWNTAKMQPRGRGEPSPPITEEPHP